ncbi:AbrB family transcriptional regulator [Bacillus solitudinis]|uniref:AbrB family transcriptional regulator n=1 Tax=Bacillus solitudinis TaxID=2014074 RepID=UPI001D0D55AF|nr:AbrB family transcriptional regulator [Bacillus solitudinis]
MKLRIAETLLVGCIGGLVFSVLNLPLPWMLGPMAFVMIWQGLTKRASHWPDKFKNSGLIVLGIYFGLYFTTGTFLTLSSYLIPFLLVTFLMILSSVFISILVTKWINVDPVTSVFGSIPGGLTEMVIASEALHAKSSYVVIFQTIRLITVLFSIPAIMLFFFSSPAETSYTTTPITATRSSYLWFVLPLLAGLFIRNRVPAGYVIGPLAVTALLQMNLSLASVPESLLVIGQLCVGIALGKNISFSDMKAGGKYGFIYFCISVILISLSFLFGFLLAQFTSLSLATAMLSVAPGGLIEMVLTASIVGADPAVVSALQLSRILVILLVVPPCLTWYFRKKDRGYAA